MELYLLRHAIAVERGTPGFADDSLRPLTDKGAQKMSRIAKGISRLDPKLDAIYSSPYVRARQTAEIVAGTIGLGKKIHVTPHLAVDGDPEDLLRVIGDAHPRGANLMLVGHEPYLSTLVSMMVSGTESVSMNFKKGGLCKLTVTQPRYGHCAVLEWLLTPRLLAMD